MTVNTANNRIPPFVRTLLTAFASLWVLFALARLVMLGLLWREVQLVPAEDLLYALYVGFKFDGRLAVFTVLPLALVFGVPALERCLKQLRPWLSTLYGLLFLAIILVYATDFGFFLYLRQRLDATIFELISETTISFNMVWQSYPVLWITFGLAVLTGLGVWGLRALLGQHERAMAQGQHAALTWKRRTVWSLGLFVLFFLVGYGQISSNLFPLRWSNAYFSVDRNLATLALNPIHNLVDTTRNLKAVRPDVAATRQSYARLASWLRIPSPDVEKLNFQRITPPNPAVSKQWNVVVILMESLSWPMTSFAPGNDNPTPNLRELARDGLYFSNFYAPARTTARAIFTSITGIPDVNRHGGTSSRNQALVDQFMIINEFKGYKKKYLIGGSASWANIRGVLNYNVQDLQLLEEGHWKAPNVDVWGISDLSLLREAVTEFNSTPQPFVAFIQTAGFHRPYTIPDDSAGFEIRPADETLLHNYGFESAEEYNSLRFSDHALGEFFRLARKEPWFENTLFAIMGDHGLNNRSTNVSPGYLACRLQGSHIPLVLYAPGTIEPGVRDFPAGQPDVFPTLAHLAGIGFRNNTMGRNLLDPATAATARQFISGEDEQSWRLVEDGLCYIREATEGLYDLNAPVLQNLLESRPEQAAAMRETAKDMYTLSKYLLFNNKKKQGTVLRRQGEAPLSPRLDRENTGYGTPTPKK